MTDSKEVSGPFTIAGGKHRLPLGFRGNIHYLALTGAATVEGPAGRARVVVRPDSAALVLPPMAVHILQANPASLAATDLRGD